MRFTLNIFKHTNLNKRYILPFYKINYELFAWRMNVNAQLLLICNYLLIETKCEKSVKKNIRKISLKISSE